MKFADRKAYHHLIKTEYSKDTDEELLLRFKPENWPKDANERIGIIQELENRKAKEQHRPACKIEEEKRNLGSYYKGPRRAQLEYGEGRDFKENRNIIRINITDRGSGRNVNNSYEMLDSYFHESRHAQQAFCKQRLNTQTSMMCEVELPMEGTKYYNYNYQSYGAHNIAIDLPNSKVLDYNNHYDMLTCEMDSNTYACNTLLELKELYKDDIKFAEYLDRRLSHFKDTNNLNNTHKYSRVLRQQDMLDNALEREHISEKEAKSIRHMLDNRVLNNAEEPINRDSIECENRIKQILKELNYRSSINYDIGVKSDYNDYNLDNIPQSDIEGINQYKTRNISKDSEAIKEIQRAGYRQNLSKVESENREFFATIDRNSEIETLKEDTEFFSKQDEGQSKNIDMQEDKSFFEKVGQKVDEFGQKMDEKLEGAMQKTAEIVTATKGQKQ